jgi:hypothetical protein
MDFKPFFSRSSDIVGFTSQKEKGKIKNAKGTRIKALIDSFTCQSGFRLTFSFYLFNFAF